MRSLAAHLVRTAQAAEQRAARRASAVAVASFAGRNALEDLVDVLATS
jgi:hypothetical protein